MPSSSSSLHCSSCTLHTKQELAAAQEQATEAAGAVRRDAGSAAAAAERDADARVEAAEQRSEEAAAAARAEASAAAERSQHLEAEVTRLRGELEEASQRAAQAPLGNGNVSNGHADSGVQAAELAAVREVRCHTSM